MAKYPVESVCVSNRVDQAEGGAQGGFKRIDPNITQEREMV